MTHPGFIQNNWYVAATAAEIGDTPLARTICGFPIVMFRTAEGAIAALTDRCPHRKAPLSLGEVVNGEIQCGYHGARFDAHGRCTAIPSQRDIAILRNFAVDAFPVVQEHDLVFVWIGEAAKADPRLVPDWAENTSSDYTTVHGYHYVRANYLLLVDNLLDLTHLTFVHKATLAAGPRGDMWLEDQDVRVEHESVHTERILREVPPTGFVRVTRPALTGPVDRFQTSDFYPPCYVRVTLGIEEAGATAMGKPHHIVLNSITPETDTTSHYFWSVPRGYALADPDISEIFYDVTKTAFDEDAAMIEAQQRMLATDPDGGTLVNFRGDRASQAARRIVTRILAGQVQAVAAE